MFRDLRADEIECRVAQAKEICLLLILQQDGMEDEAAKLFGIEKVGG